MNLQAGRSCLFSHQCNSRFCVNNVCQGNLVDIACHDHSDCMEGTFCKNLDYWPYRSVCAVFKKDKEPCDSDYQCAITHYCWYDSAQGVAEDSKVCMEKYSAPTGTKFGWLKAGEVSTIKDNEINGAYCVSGFAYESAENEATCIDTKSIEFDGEELEYPYACDPTYPHIKCHINYETSDGSIGFTETDCRCSMARDTVKYPDEDETKTGYGFCGSVIGTDMYAKAVEAKKLLYTKSNCHTLDRDNWRAHSDQCGIGLADEDDRWRFAVDQYFNVTYWPYIQDYDTYHCVQKFFSDSYINLSLSGAVSTLATAVSASIGLATLLVAA